MPRGAKTGGVSPAGSNRIQLDFRIDGVRIRPTLPWIPHEGNLGRAREFLLQIKSRIAAGTFCLHAYFPNYRGRTRARIPLGGLSCADVFDAFLAHEEARVGRADRSVTTLTSHRKILHTMRALEWGILTVARSKEIRGARRSEINIELRR